MNYYIAGKYEEREAVKRLQDELIKRGHYITVDWTKHNKADCGYPAQYAEDDVMGVKWADAYVGRFINQNHYKGALVEMGVALGRGIPVIIIGHAVDSCIFIHHPLVRQYDNEEDFLKEVPCAAIIGT